MRRTILTYSSSCLLLIMLTVLNQKTIAKEIDSTKCSFASYSLDKLQFKESPELKNESVQQPIESVPNQRFKIIDCDGNTVQELSVRFPKSYLDLHALRTFNQENKQENNLENKQRKQQEQIESPLPLSKVQQRYPIIVVLNANSFYKGDLASDIHQTVSNLEGYDDIPESIIVSIESLDWYAESITSPEKLLKILTKLLPSSLQKHFSNTELTMLVGHSYTAAFLVANFSNLSVNFEHVVAISPVYPSQDFISKIQVNSILPKVKQNASNQTSLTIYHADEKLGDSQKILKKYVKSGIKHRFVLNHLEKENHHSLLPIAIHQSLRDQFSDFRPPSSKQLKDKIYTYQDLIIFLRTKEQRYGVITPKDTLDGLAMSVGQDYLLMKRFKPAFALIDRSNHRFKKYFLNSLATHFLSLNDKKSAILIWKKTLEYFPDSPDIRKQIDLAT